MDHAVNLGLIELESAAVDATQIDAFKKTIPKLKIIDDGQHPNWETSMTPIEIRLDGSVVSTTRSTIP